VTVVLLLEWSFRNSARPPDDASACRSLSPHPSGVGPAWSGGFSNSPRLFLPTTTATGTEMHPAPVPHRARTSGCLAKYAPSSRDRALRSSVADNAGFGAPASSGRCAQWASGELDRRASRRRRAPGRRVGTSRSSSRCPGGLSIPAAAGVVGLGAADASPGAAY